MLIWYIKKFKMLKNHPKKGNKENTLDPLLKSMPKFPAP